MKLNTYKNYRTCPKCGKELPYSRKFFKRTGRAGQDNLHLICRECEDSIAKNTEWNDGKLLCHYCGEYKDVNDFTANGADTKTRNNRRTICKSCFTKRQRLHDQSLDNEKKFDKCLRWRILSAKDRAKKLNIEFNLTLDYIKDLWNKQNGRCALSNIEMTFLLKEGRVPTNVSIDRIDRTKGYIEGNVQLVCMACNQIKSDLSEVKMYEFCKKIVEYYESKNKKNS